MSANHTGILAAVANALGELGGDIHEISQTVVQRFFSIILAADFPDHRDPDVIVGHLEGVCRPFGVHVILKDPAQVSLQEPPPEGVEKHFLTLTGQDTPGVVAKVSGRLAREGIDITDMYGVGRDKSFVMILELAIPIGVDLERLGAPFGMAATLQHENSFATSNELRPARIAAARRLP
jgi:glycine cleavage system transcriptional repressor